MSPNVGLERLVKVHCARNARRLSAGLMMYRETSKGSLEVFLAHPGGPHFRRKDDGHWTIPKGEKEPGESLLRTARREFGEETGLSSSQPFHDLGWIRQKGGKIVFAWAFPGAFSAGDRVRSIEFEIEWPPHSGKRQRFPEIDKAEFFSIEEAMRKIKPTQIPFIERLVARRETLPT